MTTEPPLPVARNHQKVGNPRDDGAIYASGENPSRSRKPKRRRSHLLNKQEPNTEGREDQSSRNTEKFVQYDTKSNHVTTESSPNTTDGQRADKHGEHEKTPKKPCKCQKRAPYNREFSQKSTDKQDQLQPRMQPSNTKRRTGTGHRERDET